jgi:hypothetical protein
MDGAGLEAAEVKKIKKAAETNYRARRRGWKPASVGLDVGMVDVGAAGIEGVCEELSGKNALDGDVKELEDPWTGHVMLWEGDPVPQYSSDLSIFSGDETSLSLQPKALQDEPFSSENMFSSHAQSEPKPESYQQTDFSTACTSQDPFSTFSASQALTSTRRPPSPLTLSSLWYQSNFGTTYNVHNNAELGLLMHYLDNVFCLQFGFSSPDHSSSAPGCGRGWYLDTLLRCKPLYFATLSISAHHQYLVKGGDVAAAWAPSGAGKGSEDLTGKSMVGSKGELAKVGMSWDAERNFLMALKGLQGIIDNFQEQGLKGVELLKAWWQVLGTMCQVLSLEVCRAAFYLLLSSRWS